MGDVMINNISNRILALTLLLLTASIPVTPSSAQVELTKPGSDWLRLAPTDEEFSLLTPIQPGILIHPAAYSFSEGGEKVLSQRSYSGYADGFIFVIESYKASHPQRLLKEIELMYPQKLLEQLKWNGFDGKKYQTEYPNFIGHKYSFVTAQHVYTLMLAAKDLNHPHLARFLSSFTLGDNKAVKGTINAKREDDSVTSGPNSFSAFTGREVTRKAIVVWKPEPSYTETARQNLVAGTVVLRGVLTASGETVITEVKLGLRDGLTENAIKAAKHIKFFPAEKDGKPVSMLIQLEYNFNLY